MLKVLKRIVQDMTTASHLTDALSILVQHVRVAINAEAVTVYLLDAQQQSFVLVSTDGLNKQAEFNVRIPVSEGLVGLVAKREEPINLQIASEHPDYHYNALIGEDSMNAFLGVPIIQHRKLYGVLTIQEVSKRFFDDAEEAFLITLAAQLGGIIAHADATGDLAQLTHQKLLGNNINEPVQITLNGIGCMDGVAIGSAVVIYPPADIDNVPRQTTDKIDHEIKLFANALKETRDYMSRLSKRMKSNISDHDHAMFEVYLYILDQESLGIEVENIIISEQLTAEAALSFVIKKNILHFENMKDEYLRERATDFRDIGRRVLAALQSSQRVEITYPRRSILVGEELTAAALAEVPEGQLAGIVSAKGSNNSHVAILARAMGIPAVMGVRGLKLDQLSRRAMIIDGHCGHVFISPSKTLLHEYKQVIQKEDELNQSLESLRDKPAETLDHHKIILQVNTGLAMDSGMSMSVGAEGVGLYRSEVTFMSRDRFPSEDEQCIIYRQTLKAFAPHSVTMRTLDIGGDKILPYFPVVEENPYLGWRGIRVTLDHPDVFLLQIRAMMRANQDLNNLRILLPMVTNLSEVDEAIYLINQAYTELVDEGFVIEKPAIGVMIEVPAAAYQARELAKKVDFLSVGSNDLTQYLLAVDRNNSRVASLYDSLHPAILRTLMKIIEGGHSVGVKVSICGEMASDPLAAILLLAMGFDSLSMNSASLPRIKWLIRHFSLANARKILTDVLEIEHAAEIRFYLQKALEEQGVGNLIRISK